jgi:lysophospholipase L1-like esterase
MLRLAALYPIVLASALLACGTADTPEATTSSASGLKQHATYLALGDSIAFGDDPTVENLANENRFAGYPESLARTLELRHVNAACPGETSGSFVAEGTPDNGCRAFREQWGIHAKYDGTQLAFALDYLRDNPVDLVTIALGGNDLLMVLAVCGGDAQCAVERLPPVLAEVQANFIQALSAIRGVYQGRIVVPTYFAPVEDPSVVAGARYLNAVLAGVATALGADVADAFEAFRPENQPRDVCADGLLIALPAPQSGCDKHPSPAGDELIAQTIADVLAP